MKKILGLLCGLSFFLLLGLYLSKHSLSVTIIFNTWKVSIPLWLAGLGVIVTYLFLFVVFKLAMYLIRMISFIGDIKGSLHVKYADDNLTHGLFALIRGELKQAERLLLKVIDVPKKKTYAALALVKVAFVMHDNEKIKHYLSVLKLKNTDNNDIDDLIRAEWALKQKNYQEADYLLEGLSVNSSNNNRVLLLKKELYLHTKEVKKLQELVPLLKKYSSLSDSAQQEFTDQVNLITFEQLIREKVAFEQYYNFWESLTKKQQTKSLLLMFIPICIEHKQDPLAEELIVAALNRKWDNALISLYSQLSHVDYNKQFQKCKQWLETQNKDIDLLLVTAEIAVKLELWAQAEHYLNCSLDIKPTGKAYFLLAELQVHLDHNAQKEQKYYIKSAKLQLSEV